MATGVKDYGEEWIQRAACQDITVSSIDVGLFNDSTDSLTDSSDVGGITTEPAGSAYSRQSASMPSDISFVNNASTNVEVDVADQVFDISDSSQTVDSWFVVVTFTSNVIGSDGGDTAHLAATGSLSQSYDLSSVSFTDLKVSDIGWEAD